MSLSSYFSLLKIFLHGRSAGKILLATIFSFTFSITVILCTFCLMDGFDHLLKSGLRHSSGDILITSRNGFFLADDRFREDLQSVSPLAVAPVIQTEAFAISGDQSRGVLVRGVEDRNFSKATGLDLKLSDNQIIIGRELAKTFKLKVGDSLALTVARGNESFESLPSVKLFTVGGITEHGIYQKDLRFVYLKLGELSRLLGVGNRVNLVILSVADSKVPLENLKVVEEARSKLIQILPEQYWIKPFWSEFSYLLEAVKVEKFSISLILQLIVVVAVFNIIAFVIFIMERKAQDFFFLRAVGLSLNKIVSFWFISIALMWAMSCLGAHLLSVVFDWALHNLSFLQIPGEIYVLSSLSVRLDFMAYLTVYALSFFWIMAAALFGYWRLRRQPIIQGLRQEFN